MRSEDAAPIEVRQYVAIIVFSVLFACSCGISSWIDGSGLFKTAFLTTLYALVSGTFFVLLFKFLPNSVRGGGASSSATS